MNSMFHLLPKSEITAWFVSDLVVNPEDISHDMAHFRICETPSSGVRNFVLETYKKVVLGKHQHQSKKEVKPLEILSKILPAWFS